MFKILVQVFWFLLTWAISCPVFKIMTFSNALTVIVYLRKTVILFIHFSVFLTILADQSEE